MSTLLFVFDSRLALRTSAGRPVDAEHRKCQTGADAAKRRMITSYQQREGSRTLRRGATAAPICPKYRSRPDALGRRLGWAERSLASALCTRHRRLHSVLHARGELV